MTQPALAKKGRGGWDSPRMYPWPPLPPHEFEVISVTSAIKKGLPTPHLIGWAAKVTAERAVDKYSYLGTVIAEAGEKEGIAWLKKARYDTASEKADRGTVVHAAIEAYLAGKPFTKDQMEEELRERRVPMELWKSTAGMVSGAMEFLFDVEPDVIWSEATVYSRTHQYAGTADLIAMVMIGGTMTPVIIDFKTSKAIYDEVALQLAAYGRAEFVGRHDGSEQPLIPGHDGPIEHGIVIRPMASGRYERADFALREDIFETFLGCLAVANGLPALETARRPK